MQWYAPSRGRSVRMITKSSWRDNSVVRIKDMHGDWDIYELVSMSAPPAR